MLGTEGFTQTMPSSAKNFLRVSATGAEHLRILLHTLRRYHQQISVYVSETLYRELRDELAPFDYCLVNAVS